MMSLKLMKVPFYAVIVMPSYADTRGYSLQQELQDLKDNITCTIQSLQFNGRCHDSCEASTSASA